MNSPAYPAARTAAAKVRSHFEEHQTAAIQQGFAGLAAIPGASHIEVIIEAAFWASLRREEGRPPVISLAFLPPGRDGSALHFERPLPLTADYLTRLAPAVERPGIHIGVWDQGAGLQVWGTTRKIPTLCFVLEVIAPGLLVVKHRRGEESGKFVNVAVLEGDQIKIVNQETARLPGCPALLTSLLGFDSPSSPIDPVNVLIQLAVSMRAHGRGGALLVVPRNSEAWRNSIVHPLRYSVAPAYSELGALMRAESGERGHRSWQEALRRAVDTIAGLTAVDGATIITDSYELLVFGAKIRRRGDWDVVEQVVVTEPIEGSEPEIVHPAEIGGMRHLSATQFAHDQRDAVGLVASQDGRFTIFAWSPCEELVHAHRVEALLL